MKQALSKSMLLVTVILMDLLAGIEFDLFVPSFPELQSQFSLSPSLVEALLSVNFIGYCLSLFLVGGLADRYGRKPIILIGLITFIIGSVLCLWATAYSFLLTGRFLQGVGIAAPAILSFLIIADSYPLKKQQYFMAMLNGVMNTSVAIAPVIGSYISLYFHWQGNFITLLLLGLITLTMVTLFTPTFKLPEHKETLSLRGYLPLFQSKPLMLLMTNIIFMYVPYWIFVGISPLLYMKGLGVSLSHFGYYQGALALMFALGSVLFGLIMHKYKLNRMLATSSKIYIVGLASVAWATFLDSHNPLAITLAFIPFIVSQIIPSNMLVPLCLNFMPQAKAKVSAILQGSRLIFAALSLQLAGLFYQGSFQNIGIIISSFILAVIISQFFVINNHEIMSFTQK
ncbi:MAG TPA: MFS transporter [Gammaproteobacteria bacterium]|nr:MFS transporter [Gammaproteobacteria bacterium]